MSKLTLYVEDGVVERAKAYAKAHDTSLSKLVTQYLASLAPARDDFFTKLHADLAAEGYTPPTDAALQAIRDRHLHEKYGMPLPRERPVSR